MKKFIIKKIILSAMLPLCIFTSCDYLDVIPPEQPDVDDTMKNFDDAVGFIYSCYMAVEGSSPIPYQNYENSTDECVEPPLWGNGSQKTAWNLWSSNNGDANKYWDNYYNYIGHCHMFQNTLAVSNPRGSTEEDKARWNAEAEFLKAYYHFRLLSMYGPIPIMNQRPPQTTAPTEFAGRSHYDYTVDYIVKKLDDVALVLPAFCDADEWGRATATAAKAIKGRALLYAASDLWNGKFPHSNWKNTNYETPEYGKELVSQTYNPQKWERALEANLDALEYAEKEGHRKLMDIETAKTLMSFQKVPLPYVPGVNADTEEGKEFLQRVLLMRYVMNTYESDGNQETIWGVFLQGSNTWINHAPQPKRIVKHNNEWQNGWCAMTPTLYTAEHFYTKDGKLPALDPNFAHKDEWLSSANINDRSEIIKLNVNREPRFYANLSFDGDEFSSLISGGNPLRVNLRDGEKQGFNPDLFNRDYTVTGYFTKKYTQPNLNYSSTSSANNQVNYPKPLFRLAELYLNVAECYAALGDKTNTLKYLNPIRKRAGVLELAETDITSEMSLMDWVRSERFIELWAEGQRYYDVRRWMIAPQLLKAGAREGLNVAGAGVNPTFEGLNQRVVINQQFQWDTRMYLWPIKASEIYNDPQLVQAPGY